MARLDTEGGWPILLRNEKLAVERKAFEAAYKKVRDQCIASKLKEESVLDLDRRLDLLEAKVLAVVPSERGYRNKAAQFVASLRLSAKMFDAETLDFAQEMIKDTREHDATTVGEFLAFMRKYRLLFAAADERPGDGEIYRQLYDAMKQQKESLGLPAATADAAVVREGDKFCRGTVWVGEIAQTTIKLMVDSREGKSFTARFSYDDQTRKISGTISGGEFQWLAKDVEVIKGDKANKGHDNFGTISGDELIVKYSRRDLPDSGTYRLRLMRIGAEKPPR